MKVCVQAVEKQYIFQSEKREVLPDFLLLSNHRIGLKFSFLALFQEKTYLLETFFKIFISLIVTFQIFL